MKINHSLTSSILVAFAFATTTPVYGQAITTTAAGTEQAPASQAPPITKPGEHVQTLTDDGGDSTWGGGHYNGDGCYNNNHNQGPPGPPGPAGPRGPRGYTGPAGPKGNTGATGAQGATGAPGADGAPGTNGADGAPGANGAPGAQGPAGPAGPQGPAGNDGAPGANGTNGTNGADGAPGANGAPGAQGPAGPAGPQGPAGNDGAPGANGTNGTNGADGAPGANGAPGAQGPAGPEGPQGPQGEPGLQGEEGPQGPEGPAFVFTQNPITQYAAPGTFTHYDTLGWVLETISADNLQLRRTGFGGIAVTFGITHPAGCLGDPVLATGTAAMAQVYRFTNTVGDTLTSTFCGEGSFSLVTVFTEIQQDMVQFRCWRVSGNSNACRRVF